MGVFQQLHQNFEQGGEIHGFGDKFSQQDAFCTGSALGISDHDISNVEESTNQHAFYAGGTEFQIGRHPPHLPSNSYNGTSQGTAPRRLRLLVEHKNVQPAIAEEARFILLTNSLILEIEMSFAELRIQSSIICRLEIPQKTPACQAFQCLIFLTDW